MDDPSGLSGFKMTIPLTEIADRLKGKIIGDRSLLIKGLSGIDEAKSGEITFVSHAKYEKKAATTKASVLIVHKALDGVQKTFLVVKNPYLAFAELLAFFYPPGERKEGIDPRANVEAGVSIGRTVLIGPSATIEKGAIIEDEVQIGAGVFVGKGSLLGKGSIIYPNVTIREGVRIGQRVIIHSGTVVGSDGFGFICDQGKYKKIPQVGGVIIEDDVEIGANVTIDRATIGNTLIGRGTKIDNLVQVGHNVTIGSDTVLVSQVGLSGSVQIGSGVTLAGQVGVSGHLSIGDHVTVGGKSGVTKDIPSGQRVSGFPPVSHREWLKSQAAFHHLPGLRRQLIDLVGKIEHLEREVLTLKKERIAND